MQFRSQRLVGLSSSCSLASLPLSLTSLLFAPSWPHKSNELACQNRIAWLRPCWNVFCLRRWLIVYSGVQPLNNDQRRTPSPPKAESTARNRTALVAEMNTRELVENIRRTHIPGWGRAEGCRYCITTYTCQAILLANAYEKDLKRAYEVGFKRGWRTGNRRASVRSEIQPDNINWLGGK